MADSQGPIVRRATPTSVEAHWSKLLEGLSFRPGEFYARVEAALAQRRVPDLIVSHVTWKEGGPLSARREYLRLERQHLIFDVCGAPFGTGFFVSEWFGTRTFRFGGLFVAVAVLGLLNCMFISILIGLFLLLSAVVGFVLLAVLTGSNFDDVLMRIPGIRYVYVKFFRQFSFYRADLTCMYRAAVHAAVLQVIDDISKADGISPINDLDRGFTSQDLMVGVGRKR